MDVAKELSQLCQDKKVEFFDRLITVVESWVCRYDLDTKEMSRQWKYEDSLPQKKAKSQTSSGKVMLSVFWDRRGVIMTRLRAKGRHHHRQVLPEPSEKLTGGNEEKATRNAGKICATSRKYRYVGRSIVN
jgi:hypothetical protein